MEKAPGSGRMSAGCMSVKNLQNMGILFPIDPYLKKNGFGNNGRDKAQVSGFGVADVAD